MREIKFRAWDKQESKWYKPTHEAYNGRLWELFVSFAGDLSAHTMEGMTHQSIFPDRYDLMQYTGLKDKNGTEIYESDLVKWGGDPMQVCFGKFDNGEHYEDNESGIGWYTRDAKGKIGNYIWYHDELTVIGNIYENPDLLPKP